MTTNRLYLIFDERMCTSHRRAGRFRRIGISLLLFFTPIVLANAQPIELNSPNPDSGGNFGFISVLPDARGPGLGNVLVGAPGENPAPSPSDAGHAYIFNGSTGVLIDTLNSPNEEGSGLFGFLTLPVPDVNGDGFWDIVIGGHQEDPGSSPDNAGRAYIIDGSTHQILRTLVSPNEELGGHFGERAVGIADVNANGSGDVIVGARYEDPGTSPDNAGRAYVLDGSSGALIHTLVSPNEQPSGQFGSSVAGVPDTNGDGVNDLVVGAMLEDPGGSPVAGRAYLFDGATGAWLKTLDSPAPGINGQFGWVVWGVPDTNGDGRGEVIVGAPNEFPGSSPNFAGRAHIFDGSTGELLLTLQSPDEGIIGGARYFGFVVRGSNDLNGDGLGELLVGETQGGPDTTGQVHIFDGSNGELLYTLVSPNEEPDGSGSFAFPAEGDLNGDGVPDLVVGAWTETPPPLSGGVGRAYIYHSPFPVCEVTPTAIDCGEWDINIGPSASTSVTITNNGSGPLDLTAVEIVGVNTSQFQITQDSGESVLDVGLSRTVEVALSPTYYGDKKAKLRFKSYSFVWQAELVGTAAERPSAIVNWGIYK